ncbi:hypothetical protein B7R21_15755 [Subtercola boreus]|uniref:Uncharacterized protein n=1 Tax=Subtercola boreus TaxID=120213 RepID=A0A3E0VDA2_9MICO|nr:hypothetical protein [Subtercola boreus]RFA07629.1 hypothetical protein B7R21_15755 [Subtercola boreus]
MQLKRLVDDLIDHAKSHDVLNTYSIVLGSMPATNSTWARGKKVYRWFPVAQSGYVPNDIVVLAPVPDNHRTGELIEFRGNILTGAISDHLIRSGRER